jgi:hypothetical protein
LPTTPFYIGTLRDFGVDCEGSTKTAVHRKMLTPVTVNKSGDLQPPLVERHLTLAGEIMPLQESAAIVAGNEAPFERGSLLLSHEKIALRGERRPPKNGVAE